MPEWNIAPAVDVSAHDNEVPPLIAQVLTNRGITDPAAVRAFLHPDYSRDVHDPMLFRDMQKTLDRIFSAIDKKEKIIVHGDYDADGVTASSILYETLTAMGATVDVFLPHRETEGYGVSMQTVELLHHDGASVIITCDCGVSNAEEIARAGELGMDVIITDHHAVPAELPPAYAILHPKVEGEPYPFADLSGGGVALKLSQALVRSPRGKKAFDDGETYLKYQLDLVAISTIADMVPLIGENRALVHFGMQVLERTRRPGLKALFANANISPPFDVRTVGFTIAPRLNAAGRVRHANPSFVLLVENDPVHAAELAEKLTASNKERQDQTQRTVREALTQVKATAQEDTPAIVVASEQWPVALTGLIASRLSRQYGRPAFVLTKRGEEWMGSGRSIPGFHLVQELGALPEHPFAKLGGHPGAAGFTVADSVTPEQIRALIHARATAVFQDGVPKVTIDIDAEARIADVDWETAKVLEQCAPFGMGNTEPLFVFRGVRLVDKRLVGNGEKHVRLQLTDDTGARIKAMAFSMSATFADVAPGDTLDIAAAVTINRWNGSEERVLRIEDVRLTI